MTVDPETLQAAGLALGATKMAGDAARELVLKPISEAVSGHVKACAEAKLLPALRRILPLPEAARVAVDEAVARLGDVAPEALVEPDPTVTAGLFEAMQTRADVPELRAMFGQLLASAMHQDRAGTAHPALVEVIRQLSADDARLFAHLDAAAEYVNSATGRLLAASILLDSRRLVIREPMALIAAAGCTRPVPSADPFSNLERLGLISAQHEGSAYPESPLGELRITIEITRFGEQFVDACLPPRGSDAVEEAWSESSARTGDIREREPDA